MSERRFCEFSGDGKSITMGGWDSFNVGKACVYCARVIRTIRGPKRKKRVFFSKRNLKGLEFRKSVLVKI